MTSSSAVYGASPWGAYSGGMSMFHREDNAGSLALAAFADTVSADGRWLVFDCGLVNPHFEMYGARETSQEQFCKLVWQGLR
jgi:Leu/Phe-tRNA-protein transferase